MYHLELLQSEREILVETLEADLKRILQEIDHTDVRKFKDNLVERKKTIEKILTNLRVSTDPEAYWSTEI